jgi:hypothetical protein
VLSLSKSEWWENQVDPRLPETIGAHVKHSGTGTDSDPVPGPVLAAANVIRLALRLPDGRVRWDEGALAPWRIKHIPAVRKV